MVRNSWYFCHPSTTFYSLFFVLPLIFLKQWCFCRRTLLVFFTICNWSAGCHSRVTMVVGHRDGQLWASGRGAIAGTIARCHCSEVWRFGTGHSLLLDSTSCDVQLSWLPSVEWKYFLNYFGRKKCFFLPVFAAAQADKLSEKILWISSKNWIGNKKSRKLSYHSSLIILLKKRQSCCCVGTLSSLGILRKNNFWKAKGCFRLTVANDMVEDFFAVNWCTRPPHRPFFDKRITKESAIFLQPRNISVNSYEKFKFIYMFLNSDKKNIS